MVKNRLLYLFVLICILVFYLVYSLWVSWFLLVLALIFPLFDLLVSFPGMMARRVSLSAPPVLEKGGEGELTVATLSKNRFPAGQIKALMYASEDEKTTKQRLRCSGEQGSQIKLTLNTSRSGVILYKIPLLWVTSLMGLFSVPISVKKQIGVLILPPLIKPRGTAKLPQRGTLRPKPGGGFAEEHDIRPYRQGDSMKSIHWKLSAKRDTLIIREALEQPPHSRLVQCAPWKTPRERELILGRLRWISDYLLSRDCPYYVCLGEAFAIAEVNSFEDLVRFLLETQVHGAEPVSETKCNNTHFTWVFQIDAREDTP